MKVVAGVELGGSRPALIVPLTGADLGALLDQADRVRAAGPDLVEWRLDLAARLLEDRTVLAGVGRRLTTALGGLPLLVTVRTRAQGGAADLDADGYLAALAAVVGTGVANLLDVEMCWGPDVVARAIDLAHAAALPVIASHHDWESTPPRDVLVGWVRDMVAAGAEVAKIAVTPADAGDVLAVLGATWDATHETDRPVVAIAMGDLGATARLAGGVFGSAATFATVGAGSAPGQLDVDTVRAVLDVLHGTDRPSTGRHA